MSYKSFKYAFIAVVVVPISSVYATITLNPFIVFHSIKGCNTVSNMGSETITYFTGPDIRASATSVELTVLYAIFLKKGEFSLFVFILVALTSFSNTISILILLITFNVFETGLYSNGDISKYPKCLFLKYPLSSKDINTFLKNSFFE